MLESPRSPPLETASSAPGALLWSVEDIRAMSERRLYPSYVGSRDAGKGSVKAFPVLAWPEQQTFLNEKATSDAKTSHSEAKRRRDDDDANLVGLQTSPSPSARGESEEPASKKPRSAAEGGGGLWAGLVQPVWKWLRGFVSKENLKERDMTKEGNRSQSICPSDGVVSPPVPPSSSCGADRVQLRNDSYDSGEPKVVSLQEKLFNDLHTRGYCVGPGSAYGGTYCIYDGNPDESHSLATVRLVDDGLISAIDIQAYSRVQNQVAKSAVLAFCPDDSPSPHYLSFEFIGVSSR